MEKSDLIKKWEIYNFNEKTLEAFKAIERRNFVLPEYKKIAYEDIALPYLADQTISQPFTVVFMTNKLNIKPGDKILEIGTGSGYQTAILSYLVGKNGKVITFDIIPEIIDKAKENLKSYKNVEIHLGNASAGYLKESTYDKIIATAGAKRIPQRLIEQLKEGGVLILPVGSMTIQKLIKITKTDKGTKKEELGNFIFVPLKDKYP